MSNVEMFKIVAVCTNKEDFKIGFNIDTSNFAENIMYKKDVDETVKELEKVVNKIAGRIAKRVDSLGEGE